VIKCSGGSSISTSIIVTVVVRVAVVVVCRVLESKIQTITQE
jgi:hypothetical protein